MAKPISEQRSRLVASAFASGTQDEAGLCVLFPRLVGEVEGYLVDNERRQLPESAVFDENMSTGVLLIAPLDELEQSPAGAISGQSADADLELAQQVDYQMRTLLSCVHHPTMPIADSKEPALLADCFDQVDHLIVIAHGSAANQTIGGLPAEDLAAALDKWNAKEAVVLACRAGCGALGPALSRDGIPIVAPVKAIDARQAFIFTTVFISKRFGEGLPISAAYGQAMSAVVGDPYQLWINGMRV